MENHLSAFSNIIVSKDFEEGRGKCIDGRSLFLTLLEKQRWSGLKKKLLQ